MSTQRPGSDPKSNKDRAALLREAIRRRKAQAGGGKKESPAAAQTLPRRPDDVPPRLGPLQRSLWLAWQMAPDSVAYNLASAVRLSAPLNFQALQQSFLRLLRRHRILRSTFRADGPDGGVLQVIAPEPDAVDVEVHTVETGQVRATAETEGARPFSLEQGPLVRLLLIDDGQERLLMLVLHHILADARSLGALWKDLAEVYGQALDGSTSTPTADLPQYDDWVHAEGHDAPKEDTTDIWRRRLTPWPEDLQLPFERRAGQHLEKGRDGWIQRPLPDAAARGIQSLAADAGTTPFAVYAFFFRLLLHRLTDGRDVAFGLPVSRRQHAATAPMVGYFLNTVVLRHPLDEAASVEAEIGRFAKTLRSDMGHGDLPFDRLVDALDPPRLPGRQPLFQAMFVFQESAATPRFGDVSTEPVHVDLGAAKFDFTLFVTARQDRVEVAVEFRRQRFETQWMERLLEHVSTLATGLGAIAADRPLREVPLLSAAQRAQIANWSRGPGPLLDADPVSLQILRKAKETPDADAVICGDDRWNYGHLHAVGLAIAIRLRRQGVGLGDRVGLYLDRSPLQLAGILGCHWAGAAYVPLDPAYPSQRNLDVLRDADIGAVLTRGHLVPDLPKDGPLLLDLQPLAHMAPPEPSGLPDPPIVEDGLTASLLGSLPAYLLYTSGSTGRPKGVVISQEALRRSNGVRPQVYGQDPGRFLLLSSVAFDSSVVGIFWTLTTGGCVTLPDAATAKDPERLAASIEVLEITSLLCVPSLYRHVLDADGDRLKSLQLVMVAGEACPPELVGQHFRQLPNARLFNEYGPTEATVWATVYEMAADDGPVSIGRPVPGLTVEVLDGEDRPLPPGVPGHGWISGPNLADGYWRRPGLSSESFRVLHGEESGGRRYRTGDRLAWTPEGTLQFLGRVDGQIKLRGFRIEPGEIEAPMTASNAVKEAAVVLRNDEKLVGFVAIEADEENLPETLSAMHSRLEDRLPPYMVPGRLVPLEELPKLPNGKVDRRRLQSMPLPEAPGATSTSGGTTAAELKPVDPNEQALLSLWRGLLGRSDITMQDHFFQLGGHSLLAVEMAASVRRDLGIPLSPAEVFQHPTLEGLCRHLEARQEGHDAPYAHLFPLQPDGSGAPLVFAIPHFFSQTFAQRFRGERPVYGLRGVGIRPEGNRGRWPTMAALGQELVDEVLQRFGRERAERDGFVLAGYSFGASMAVEATRILEERGLSVHRLLLIAPMALDVARLGPFSLQVDDLRQPVGEVTVSQALGDFLRRYHPFSRRLYELLWRRLGLQNQRRLLCAWGDLRRAQGKPLTPDILHADVRLERFRLHRGYRPGVVQAPTLFFNPKEPATDAAATWRPHFGGPLEVVPTPDPHLGPDAVEAARQVILPYLDHVEQA